MLYTPSKRNIISFRSATIVGAFIVIIYMVILTILQNNPNRIVFSDIFTPLINILVVICLFYAAKRSKTYGKRTYLAWTLLAFAQLAFTAGDILWMIMEVVFKQNPFPSIADALYVVYYPIFAIGIFLLPKKQLKKREIYKTLLDMGIITISFALIFWIFLIWPTIQAGHSTELSVALNLYYIVADFVLLFVLFYLLLKIQNLKEIPLILLAGAITAQIISDIVFAHFNLIGTYITGDLADVGWLLGYVLIGLAGIYQATVIRDTKITPKHELDDSISSLSFIPIIWVIITYILIPWAYINTSESNLIILEIGVGFSIFLVMLRQFINSTENRILYVNAQKEILQREKTEKSLKESEMQYHTTVDSIDDALHVIDTDFKLVLFNDSLVTWNKELRLKTDIIGDYLFDIFPFLGEDTLKEYKKVFETGKILLTEESNRINGELFHTETKKIPIFEEDKVKRVVTIIRDITKRKLSDKKLKKKTEETIGRQKALLEISKTDISLLEMALKKLTEIDSKVLDVERVSVWFLNDDKSEIKCRDLYKLSQKTHERGQTLLAKDYPFYFKTLRNEHNIAATDAYTDSRTAEFAESYLKELRIISMLDIPIWLHGELVGVLCHEHVGSKKRKWTFEEQDFAASIAHMVSMALETDERKKAEKIIKKSLHEKELLLKEVHHRVKNNMQIISSLLNLQSRYIHDERVLEIFKESQNRVKSMSMVHENLYQSEDFTKIDFTDYIHNMISSLYISYGIHSDIKININIDDISLGIDTAIPCGLIINELITNSVKHAFPFLKYGLIDEKSSKSNKKDPQIDINFYMGTTDNSYNLVVRDNGIGIPKNMDLSKTKSLGLRLIRMLVDQLNGTIKLDRHDGATFIINFKEIKSKPRI
ncbi:MAG: GAF domain-containing protein [Methanobacterium sp.]|uniref:histidine kinase dimerization/phosphoacceptor domain -containing protein n=1 Tax=Methanobacterium sp. TaxID=2164 RepID=UPI003D65F897|nr:GAF domain-containing protein [Methanobacterium sp.]